MPCIVSNEASAPRRFTCHRNRGLRIFRILLPVHDSFPVILPGFERPSTPGIPETGPGWPRHPVAGSGVPTPSPVCMRQVGGGYGVTVWASEDFSAAGSGAFEGPGWGFVPFCSNSINLL